MEIEILPLSPVKPMKKVIEDTILNALAVADGNVAKVARMLKITDRTVFAHLNRMGFSNGVSDNNATFKHKVSY